MSSLSWQSIQGSGFKLNSPHPKLEERGAQEVKIECLKLMALGLGIGDQNLESCEGLGSAKKDSNLEAKELIR